MFTPAIIIVSALFLSVVVLVISECSRRRYNKKALATLRQEKLKLGLKESEIDEDDLKDEIEPQQRFSRIFGIVICLNVWILGAVVTHLWAEHYFTNVSEGNNKQALFGDSFGAVNALVSALAFASMIVAFILQRYELRLQRKELRDNRREMMKQTKQFRKQNRNLQTQRFENLFYNMLNLQEAIVEGLRYEYYEEEYHTVAFAEGGSTKDKVLVKREVIGRDVFRFLFESVVLDIQKSDGTVGRINGYKGFLNHKGLENYDTTQIPTIFDHYFRHLYKIVQFVEQENPNFDKAYRYLSFLRGTLSRYELVWLYYNALHPDFVKFKHYIEKYSLLKALRADLLTISYEVVVYYQKLGLTKQELEDNGFGAWDFDFYLTDQAKESEKYHLSAFWNKHDIHAGEDYLNKWRAFIDAKAAEVVKNI